MILSIIIKNFNQSIRIRKNIYDGNLCQVKVYLSLIKIIDFKKLRLENGTLKTNLLIEILLKLFFIEFLIEIILR